MSTVFSTRRRADRFDALLADPTGVEDARFAELLHLVAQLEAVPAPRPRADFSSLLREQLLVEAETALLPQDHAADDRLRVPARSHRTTRSPRERRIAVAAGALAMVGATTSMAVASQSALPGDTLYPVKRALEDVHAGVSMGDAARGSTLLANASGRLDEVSELARIGTDESLAGTSGALQDFVAQAEEGSALLIADYLESGDPRSIATVRDFTGQSLGVLAELEGQLPAEADEALLDAAEVLSTIDAEAADLCATCGGLGIAELPPSLVAGLTDDSGAVSSQPVQPGRPLRPEDSAGGASGTPGSGSAGADGSGGQGDGSSSGGGDVALPDVGGVLPPGSVTGDKDGGSGPAEDLTDDLRKSLTGNQPSSGGADGLLQPLKQTSKQIDELLEASGLTGGGSTGGQQGSQQEQGSPTKKRRSGGGSGPQGSGDDLLGGLLGN